MTISKIRRGLDAMQKTGSYSTAQRSTASRIANLTGTKTSIQDLKIHRHEVKQIRDELTRVKTDLQNRITARTKGIELDYKNIGFGETDKGGRFDNLGKQRRQSMRNTAITSMRNSVIRESSPKAVEKNKHLVKLRQKLSILQDAYSSPLKVLNRETLLSNDRLIAQGILKGAGVNTINAAATEAMMTGNKSLAAAVTSILDDVPKSQKNLLKYSRNEIATAVVFEDFNTASEQLIMTEYLLMNSEDLVHEIVTGKSTNSERKIRTATIKQELASRLGRLPEELDRIGDAEGQSDA